METQVEQTFDMALNAANHDRNQAMLDFAHRIYAPVLAELDAANQALSHRVGYLEAELAKLGSQLERANATNAELACDYIRANRRAIEYRKRALALLRMVREWRRDAFDKQQELSTIMTTPGDASPCMRCNGKATAYPSSPTVKCNGCGRIEFSCTCKWHEDGPIGNEPTEGGRDNGLPS